jgi:hypothetical protein
MSWNPSGSDELYQRWVELGFLKRAMLSFHYLPANTGLDVKPTDEQLCKRIMRSLVSYNRETGDFIPMEGVLSPEYDEDHGILRWPHAHLVLQGVGRDPEAPLLASNRLIAHARANWLVCKYSNHPRLRDPERETDLRLYSADHLQSPGAKYLPGKNVVTNLDVSSEVRAATSKRRRDIRAARSKAAVCRQEADDEWMAQNDRSRGSIHVLHAGSIVAASGKMGATGGDCTRQSHPDSSASEPLVPGRQILVGLRLVDSDVINTRRGRYRSTKYALTFRDDHGRQYRWYGTNPSPITLCGYRHAGRYPVSPWVPLTFSATVREIWRDGTASISRPYIRLDRQPEPTKRAYGQQLGISLEALELEGP